MKKKLLGIITLGIIASQTYAVSASELVGMIPQNLVYTGDGRSVLYVAASDTGEIGYNYTGTGTTGGAGMSQGTADTTGGGIPGGDTGTTGAGMPTGTTVNPGVGTAPGVSGTTGTTTEGYGGGNTGGYIGNPANYDSNAVGNTNEMYQNTNRTDAMGDAYRGMGGVSQGISANEILPARLNNRTQDSKSLFNLETDTYIVRDGDSLWLVMGQIKAKLDVLIYIDPANMNNESGGYANPEADKNNLGSSGNPEIPNRQNSDTNANTNNNANYGIPIYR